MRFANLPITWNDIFYKFSMDGSILPVHQYSSSRGLQKIIRSQTDEIKSNRICIQSSDRQQCYRHFKRDSDILFAISERKIQHNRWNDQQRQRQKEKLKRKKESCN